MASVSVRYIVSEVDAALAFYRDALGFDVVLHPAPAFAILARGELRLLLSAPVGSGGGAQPSLDGHAPEPGGWNRFQLEVIDLAAEAARLREMGVRFRTDVVIGIGGDQVVIEDPSGNPIELFAPKLDDTRPSTR